MSRCFRSLIAILVASLPLAARADEKPKGIKAEKTWNGIVDLKLRATAPRTGYVADKELWESLWKLFRGAEEIPKVDFKTELVLIAVNSDPNGISITATLDEKGDLKLGYASTLIAFNNPTTCAYQFMVIKREGIKSVGGNSLPK